MGLNNMQNIQIRARLHSALKVKLSLKSMLCSAFLQISLLPVYSYIYIAVMAHVDVDQLQFDAILQFIYYARIAVCDTII